MGIPYSREINKAFDELNKAYGQVTPLIEAAYEVLETTKNISLLLAAIQVLTVVLLGLILLASVGILITLNPAFEAERDELVVPMLQWVTGWMKAGNIGLGWFGWITIAFLVITAILGILTTRHGRWVKQKVKESVTAGQSRLEKKMEQSKKNKKKSESDQNNENEEDGDGDDDK